MQKDVTTSWGTFDHGSVQTALTAVQLTTTSTKCEQGVWVKAAGTNVENVFVGNSDVTAGTANGTDGYILDAGENVFVAVNNVTKVYVLGNDINQKVYWLSV